MIAEIYHKYVDINSEDQLTGNVFGVLRYLPYEIFRSILCNCIEPHVNNNVLPGRLLLDKHDKWGHNVEFWPKAQLSRTEPDVIIELDDTVILIEVKYNNNESGADQLLREAEMLSSHYKKEQNKILILIAPNNSAKNIYLRNKDEIKKCCPKIIFCYIAWQKMLESVSKYKDTNLICSDIADLLHEKGFDVFRGFGYMDKETLMAFKTVRESHEKVDKFIDECINLSEEKKEFTLAPMTLSSTSKSKKCLRWNTDTDYRGWSYLSFIIAFQCLKDRRYPNNEWRNGPLFIIEISFDYKWHEEPIINIARFDYKSLSSRSPLSISEYWNFYNPLYNGNYIDSLEKDRKYYMLYDDSIKKYGGLQRIMGYEIPLSEITSENIYEQIFNRFLNMKNCDDHKLWIKNKNL